MFVIVFAELPESFTFSFFKSLNLWHASRRQQIGKDHGLWYRTPTESDSVFPLTSHVPFGKTLLSSCLLHFSFVESGRLRWITLEGTSNSISLHRRRAVRVKSIRNQQWPASCDHSACSRPFPVAGVTERLLRAGVLQRGSSLARHLPPPACHADDG